MNSVIRPKEQVTFQDLGQIDYQKAWDLQERLLKENVELKMAAGSQADPLTVPTRHYLLFCEHPPVYTLGKSGSPENLLIDEDERASRGIAYYRINRGGDITYHGPGQITGYPILDLEKFRRDIGWYLRQMEQVMIELLAEYGLVGERIKGATGVWVDANSDWPRKICAFGVRCSRWVTMHGFALNVNTDLSYFDHIVPCGIEDKGVTSLQAELGRSMELGEVQERLKGHFARVFDFNFVK